MCATRSPTTSPRLRIRCVCARRHGTGRGARYRSPDNPPPPRTVIGVRWGRDESRLPRQARASCPLRHRCVPTEPSAASSRLRHQTSARNVRGTRDQVPRHARRRRQKDMGRSLTAPHGARRGLGGKSEFGAASPQSAATGATWGPCSPTRPNEECVRASNLPTVNTLTRRPKARPRSKTSTGAPAGSMLESSPRETRSSGVRSRARARFAKPVGLAGRLTALCAHGEGAGLRMRVSGDVQLWRAEFLRGGAVFTANARANVRLKPASSQILHRK